MAEEELGRALYANIIMLGALSGVTEVVSFGSLQKAVNENVPIASL
jgi:Pyruvate/2-oxoacid:ferredoxin oxidoreductase gamma subunit